MPEPPAPPLDARCRELEDAISDSTRRDLETYQNVAGTAVGPRVRSGQRLPDPVLIVYVAEKIAEEDLTPAEVVPKTVPLSAANDNDDIGGGTDSIETDVREVGQWSADIGSPTRKEIVRPVVGGVEVGAGGGSATVTGLFETRDGHQRLLTARHIFSGEQAALGGTVRQPAGGPEIGEVRGSHEFIVDSGTRRNLLDTVLVEPSNENMATGQYLGWHDAKDTGRPRVGDRVTTFSATGGIAGGTVVARGVQVSVDLPSGETARYGGLVEYDWGGASGSSGAAVGRIKADSRELTIVGQHVASASGASLMAPWTTIERQFGHLTPVSDYYVTRPGLPSRGDASVTIRVEDSSGNPVRGATVTVEQVGGLTSSATIVVEDESGNPIPGASVTVEQT